jgi:signal transduction histidine kinase/ActR/RegA family two-component response regulator
VDSVQPQPSPAVSVSPADADRRPRLAALATLTYICLYAFWVVLLRDRSTAIGLAIDDLAFVPLNIALVVALLHASGTGALMPAQRRALRLLAAMYACTAIGNTIWYADDAIWRGNADYGVANVFFFLCYPLGVLGVSALPLRPMDADARRRYHWDLAVLGICVTVMGVLFTVPYIAELWLQHGHATIDAAYALCNLVWYGAIVRILLRQIDGHASRHLRQLAWGMSVQAGIDFARQWAVAGPNWQQPIWFYPVIALGYVGMLHAAIGVRTAPVHTQRTVIGNTIRAASALPLVMAIATFIVMIVSVHTHSREIPLEWLLLGAIVVGIGLLAHARNAVVAHARLATQLAATEVDRRYDRRLRDAEKQEALGRMASGVAHDFNNLITAIIANCELASDDVGPDAAIAEDLREIRLAALRGGELTRQLLVFSRRDQPHAISIDISATLLGLHRLLLRVAGERVHVTLDADVIPGSVRIDRGQLEQALVNLVANARDAMRGAGTIRITARATTFAPSDTLGHDLAFGDYVTISVTDTGSGIPPETLHRIFEPFFTTKPVGEGTGLGLATAHATVRAAGGLMAVHSEVGVGTTFRIILPRRAEPAEAIDRPDTATSVERARGETVLVVEDDATVRQISRMVLMRAGFAVLSAANLEDARRLMRAHREPLALVLADVVLPDGVGAELITDLRQRSDETPLLMMSGYSAEEVSQFATDAEDASLLRKPFTPAELVTAVRDAIRRATLQPTG